MKNCVSGGKHMTTHTRPVKKQPSEARIQKLMRKKQRKGKK